jgi:hypothetical protein
VAILTTNQDGETHRKVLSYEGEHLVMSRDEEDSGKMITERRFEYEGDTLVRITQNRSTAGLSERRVQITYEADRTIATNDGFTLTRITRDAKGRIVDLHDALSRRRYTWKGDRLMRMAVEVGGMQTGAIDYRYSCE